MLLEEINKRTGSGRSSDVEDHGVPAALTDTGCERDLNEDRYAVIDSTSGLAWMVCDGMGGVAGGELAAQLAIDGIRRDLENLPPRPPEVAFKSALLEANRIIVLRRQNQAFADMGTTITGAIFYGSEVVLGHVGDSRAYLVRDGAIQQLSTDHTYVQELVDRGQIRADEALSHPQAHILTRCIGAEPGLEVDLEKFWIWEVAEGEPRDFLVLCTDGLYSLVTEVDIANVVSERSPQRACVELVELAKSRGGFDNITIAVIPLMGQLRQEPPIGYDASRRGRQSDRDSGRHVSSLGLLKTSVIVVTLSVLVALLTALGMIFWLSR